MASPPPSSQAKSHAQSTTVRDSPGRIASWFIDTWGGGPGRSKADIIEVIFDRLEAGQTFALIREELDAFGAEQAGASIALLKSFLASR